LELKVGLVNVELELHRVRFRILEPETPTKSWNTWCSSETSGWEIKFEGKVLVTNELIGIRFVEAETEPR
jgi:hypothetical protein